MTQECPLSRIAVYVAAARARGRPTRLVLRNTERVGVVHLYFQHGHLVSVEGHRGSGLASLADVATWTHGTIRQDDLDNQSIQAEADPVLEEQLAEVVRRVQARAQAPSSSAPRLDAAALSGRSFSSVPRVSDPAAAGGQPRSPASAVSDPRVTAADTALTLPVPPQHTTAQSTMPRHTAALDTFAASVPGATPPRSMTPSTPPNLPLSTPSAPASGADVLSEPQWQLIALVMHQVIERARQDVGPDVAEGFLVQALTRLGSSAPFLRTLEVDEAGWLHVRPDHLVQHPAFDVVSAIASLLMEYEARCAALVGLTQARKIITDASGPLRAPLAQIGLDISPQ